MDAHRRSGGASRRPSPGESGIRRGRLKLLFRSARTIARVAWRDPANLPERLMLAATDRLGAASRVPAEGNAAAAIRAAGRGATPGTIERQLIRSALLFLSVAVSVGFVVFADHVRNHVGINWVSALGALVALSLVISMSVYARSR